MTIHIRPYRPADRDFILSLVARFTEFELPAWRTQAEIDAANQQTLEKALAETEAGAAS